MSKFHYMLFSKEPVDIRYVFQCPGCRCSHYVRVSGGPPIWQFNGDVDKPTVSPSILVGHVNASGKDTICHSFVRDGRIEFLSDCNHELAGQTVDLPDFDL